MKIVFVSKIFKFLNFSSKLIEIFQFSVSPSYSKAKKSTQATTALGTSSTKSTNSVNTFFNQTKNQNSTDLNNNSAVKGTETFYPNNFASNKTSSFLNRSADDYCQNQATCLEQCDACEYFPLISLKTRSKFAFPSPRLHASNEEKRKRSITQLPGLKLLGLGKPAK